MTDHLFAALPAETGAQPLNFLLVEDNKFDVSRIRSTLSRAGFDGRLREARSLVDARRVLFDDDIDMILLDNSLPDGAGLDLVRELASDGRIRTIRVVMISGDPSDPLADLALKAGCSAFIPKDNLNATRLGEALDAALRRTADGAADDEIDARIADTVHAVMTEFAGTLHAPLTRARRYLQATRAELRANQIDQAMQNVERLEELMQALECYLFDEKPSS